MVLSSVLVRLSDGEGLVAVVLPSIVASDECDQTQTPLLYHRMWLIILAGHFVRFLCGAGEFVSYGSMR